jgi:hypothetical protein
MLSKDHFSNRLNGVAGRVATTILQYVTPRILYAWQNPGVPIEEVMQDILRAFHHPALRDESLEIHRNMFNTVRKWTEEQPDRHNLNNILSSASVKAGHNHKGDSNKGLEHNHGALGGHGKTSGSIWTEIKSRDLGAMEGTDFNPVSNYMTTSPAPGSPNLPPQSPQFGYQNIIQRPGSSNYDRPGSSNYLNPNPGQQGGGYYGGPPQGQYQQNYGPPIGYQQPSYAGHGPPPGPYQQAPYPGVQQPMYGNPYPPQGPPQGPPFGQYGGPPGPPGGFQGGPQPHGGPYQQYPPQQPPYGGGGGYGY